MIINVHAGHNPDGKIACGASGLLKESTEARAVKNEVIRGLQLLGHTVYDCTVDDGKSQGDVLSKIVKKCNSHKVDLDVSIHFNAGANDPTGNGKTTGTEVYLYNLNSEAREFAWGVANAIESLGFKNRGVKTNGKLYVLRKTNAPAMLIECCFVDDADDAALYTAESMAKAIVFGLTGQKYEEPQVDQDIEATTEGAETPQGTSADLYRVQVGAFSQRDNAEKLKAKLIEEGFQAFITR